jgi:hypothetical protein
MYQKRSAFQLVSISAISQLAFQLVSVSASQLSAVSSQSFTRTYTGAPLHFYPLFLCVLCVLYGSILPATAQDTTQPTLADFWAGRADWVLDIANVGLPVGESDTVQIDDNIYWTVICAENTCLPDSVFRLSL